MPPLSSSYPHRTLLCLALLSACTNGPEAMGDPTSELAGTPVPTVAPTAPPALTAVTPTTATATTPAMLPGVTSPDAAPINAAAFRELIAADWEVPPGTEQYVCARLTLAETLFVGNWGSEAPLGTHHTIVSASAQPDGEPDGVTECNGGTLGTQTVYVSGIGTRDYKLPSGVAVKLTQGTQLILNLHLFNTTDEPLRGRSGARIQPLDENDVRELADILNVSAIKLEVPPGRSTSQVRCTLNRDTTVFGVGPHMHETGVALQAIAHTALHGDVMLFDGPFSFNDQNGHSVEPLLLKAGDTVDVACTYDNPSDKTLHFGESSKDEMCGFALMRYPAGGPGVCAK